MSGSQFFLKIFIFGVRVFPFFCTYISEGTFTSPRSSHEERSGPETCMIPQGGSRSSKSGGTSTPAGNSSVRSADCPPPCMLLFAALILRGFWIALHARDRFGSLMVVGVMTLVGLQTFFEHRRGDGPAAHHRHLPAVFQRMAARRCPSSWRRWASSCRYPGR